MHARDESDRCVWIDAAKGIGIGLVVFGHMNIPEPLRQYLYCFHVPLFFFLSGLLHRRRPLGALAVRRTRTLLVPYVLFSVIAFALYGILGVYRAGDYAGALAGIVLGTPSTAHSAPIQPQWFLLCLFTTEMAYGLVLVIASDHRLMMLLPVAAMAAVGFINGRTSRVVLPWGVATSLVAVLFYYTGDCFRDVAGRLLAMKTGAKIGGAAALGVIVFLAARINGRVDMAYNRYGSIPVFLSGAIAGVGMVVLLSMALEPAYRWARNVAPSEAVGPTRLPQLLARFILACLLYAGRNTLILLSMHMVANRLAAHCLATVSLASGGVLHEVLEKSTTALLLVASIEVFRRCPLVVHRERSGKAADPLRIRPDWSGAAPVLAGCSPRVAGEANDER